jgi:hypothetical protein
MRKQKTSDPGRAILAFCSGLCLALVLGCGDDNGTGTPPRISNLFFAPTSGNVGQRGMVGVSISLEYADPDGDLAFVRLSSRPCGEKPVEDVDIAPGGITGNLVWLSTMITTACPPGTYTYEVSVFDQKGHQSNSQEATFTLGR